MNFTPRDIETAKATLPTTHVYLGEGGDFPVAYKPESAMTWQKNTGWTDIENPAFDCDLLLYAVEYAEHVKMQNALLEIKP